MRSLIAMVCIATGSYASATQAQATSRLASVEGVAFDSVARKPLAGALISVSDVRRTATSDAKGRFRIDSVPAGTYTMTMQHAVFDSLGLSGVSERVAVMEKMPRVIIAVPSFATLWRAACGDASTPADSGFVFGAVLDAVTTTALAGARVEVSWVDLVGRGKSLAEIGQRRWRRAVSTDERGQFALCGVPINTALTLTASLDSATVATIEVAGSNQRVQRREILLARPIASPAIANTIANTPAMDSAASSRPSASPPLLRAPSATLVGTVTTETGTPIANAVVAVDTLAEIRTGEDGKFILRDVPAGTRTVRVVAIGHKAHDGTLNLVANEQRNIIVPLTRITTLETVKVKANVTTARILAYEERRRNSLGTFRDSTEIPKYPYISSILRMVPNASLTGKGLAKLAFGPPGHRCEEEREQIDWRLDGHPTVSGVVETIDLNSIAAMEIYPSIGRLPGELWTNLRFGCAIWIWTKRGFGK